MKKSAGKTQKTVIVLGPARSGTSLTCGVLNILGVDFGDVILPGYGNPTGFFEDKDVRALTKEVLLSAGGKAKQPPTKEKILAQRKKFDSRIKDIVEKRSRTKNLWGWKLPSASLITELFLPHIKNPNFVIVFRNPMGTANSLIKHQSYLKRKVPTLTEALKLSNYYYSEIFDLLDRHPEIPHFYISYEELLNDSVSVSHKAADFLDVNLDDIKIKKIKKIIIPRDKLQSEKRKAEFKYVLLRRPVRFLKKSLNNPSNLPRYLSSALRKNFKI